MSRTPAAGAPSPTELESCVLGVIEHLGSCTRYAVRKYLAESLSSYWSGSTGAIYPMLERFTRKAWVEVEEQPFGTRKRMLYRLSTAGRRRLRRWLSAPVPDAAAAHTHDPIRTRVFFLDLVTPADQVAFLDDAIGRTVETIERHRQQREDVQAISSQWDLRGREGAIRELTTRVEWLRDVLTSVRAGPE